MKRAKRMNVGDLALAISGGFGGAVLGYSKGITILFVLGALGAKIGAEYLFKRWRDSQTD